MPPVQKSSREPRAESESRPRRHRSEPRERILALLRASDTHPTAAELHEALRRKRPQLSLGTVYRNLEILVAEGTIDAVRAEDGPLRYDGNTRPHHHFHCDACGAILDLDLKPPRGLLGRLEREHGLRADRVRIDFHGLCEACEP